MKDLVVLILAGGDGGRFWPLGDKHSLPFLGKPFAYYHLSQLVKFGLKDIVIVTSKINESFFQKLSHEFSGLNIQIIPQSDSRGMAGAIVSAEKYISGKPVLIRNGSDIYEDLLLSSIIPKLKGNPEGIISGVTQNNYFPGGYLKILGDKVVSIVEKPSPEKIPSHIVTVVFDYFKNADLLISAISKMSSDSDDIFERAIDFLIKDGIEFKFLPYSGFWGYLKFPWHVLNISSYFLGKISKLRGKNVVVAKSSVIKDKVYLGDNVRILENAKIIGPTYIGKNTIIGNNAIVRESIVDANCVVGFGCEIARSHVGSNCWFHTNYVGDSVISDNVSMGAGAVLANFKLNEGGVRSVVSGKRIDTGKVKLGSIIGTGVRIGVNASIMPGVKIGKNSFVGSGVVLDHDLPEGKVCFLESKSYKIKDNKAKVSATSRKDIKSKLNSALK